MSFKQLFVGWEGNIW